jgi:hypothetical protein
VSDPFAIHRAAELLANALMALTTAVGVLAAAEIVTAAIILFVRKKP